MRKIISGITALLLTASASAAATTYALLGDKPQLKADINGDKYYSEEDISIMNNIFFGKSDDVKTGDLNGDGTVNIADYILFKNSYTAAFSNNTVAELNEEAKEVYEAAVLAFMTLNNGKVIEDYTYISEDGSEFSETVNEYIYKGKPVKWKVEIVNGAVCGAAVSSDDGAMTGAFPNCVPQSVCLPFEESKKALFYGFGSDYVNELKEKYTSSDPEQAALPDYSERTVSDLNYDAKVLFTLAEILYSNDVYPENNSEYTGIFNSERLMTEKEYKYLDALRINSGISLKNLKYAMLFEKGRPVSCICYESVNKNTGAYPLVIPRNYDIPVKDGNDTDELKSLCTIASANGVKWEDGFSECISSDPEQAALSPYPERSVYELNTIARLFANEIQKAATEFEMNGTAFVDGKHDESTKYSLETSGLMLKYMHIYNDIKYTAVIKDYEVISCVVSDESGEHSGAYPYSVPLNMNIPYSKASEADEITMMNWVRAFPDYVGEEYSDGIETLYQTDEMNNKAKEIYDMAQMILQNMETEGKIAEQKEIKNDVRSEITDMLEDVYPGIYSYKYRILQENNIVKNVVVSDYSGKISGAYPVAVPSVMDIPFEEAVKEFDYYSNISEKEGGSKMFAEYMVKEMNEKSGKYSTDNLLRRALAFGKEVGSVEKMNEKAKLLYDYVSVLLVEEETKGNIVSGTYDETSDEEFLKSVNNYLFRMTGELYSPWTVIIKDGVLEGCFVSNSQKRISGAYPNAVPAGCAVRYASENAMYSSAPDGSYWTEHSDDYLRSVFPVKYGTGALAAEYIR